MNPHRLSRPQTAAPSKKKSSTLSQNFIGLNKEEMNMDIDERINDKAIFMHEETIANK